MCSSSPFRTCARCEACSTVLSTLINFRKASSAVFDKLLRFELITKMDVYRGRMYLNPYLQGSKHQKYWHQENTKYEKRPLFLGLSKTTTHIDAAVVPQIGTDNIGYIIKGRTQPTILHPTRKASWYHYVLQCIYQMVRFLHCFRKHETQEAVRVVHCFQNPQMQKVVQRVNRELYCLWSSCWE